MKPTLPYPDPIGHCKDCSAPIDEHDFFGFIWGYLFCKRCYKFLRRIRKWSFEQKYHVKISTWDLWGK